MKSYRFIFYSFCSFPSAHDFLMPNIERQIQVNMRIILIMTLKVVIKLVVRANFMMDSQIVNGK
jgi:hypothetical protein